MDSWWFYCLAGESAWWCTTGRIELKDDGVPVAILLPAAEDDGDDDEEEEHILLDLLVHQSTNAPNPSTVSPPLMDDLLPQPPKLFAVSTT